MNYVMMVAIILSVLIDVLTCILGNRDDKTSNLGCYIQAVTLLWAKIFPTIKTPDGNIWNTEQATAHHQDLRKCYEEKLCTLLEMGVVNDFEQLKKFIDKL